MPFLPAAAILLQHSAHRYCPIERKMTGSKFLKLPRELRDIIYLYSLPNRIQLVRPGHSLDAWSGLGLLLVSRQIRLEALHAVFRLLPQTTVVIQRKPTYGMDDDPLARLSPLQTAFRSKIVHLVLRLPFRKQSLPYFSLQSESEEHTNAYMRRLIHSMPALREVTCEVTWEPNRATTIMFPGIRSDMITEIKNVTLGYAPLPGWVGECHIRDATRWRNGWSGIVHLSRSQ